MWWCAALGAGSRNWRRWLETQEAAAAVAHFSRNARRAWSVSGLINDKGLAQFLRAKASLVTEIFKEESCFQRIIIDLAGMLE